MLEQNIIDLMVQYHKNASYVLNGLHSNTTAFMDNYSNNDIVSKVDSNEEIEKEVFSLVNNDNILYTLYDHFAVYLLKEDYVKCAEIRDYVIKYKNGEISIEDMKNIGMGFYDEVKFKINYIIKYK
jgi:hypothetical protein